MKIITIAIIALLSACVTESDAPECTDMACMAETSASFVVSAEVLAQLTPVGDGPITSGCPYSPDGPIGCCYTIGQQQCCCIPKANGTFQCQCTTVIVVSPNNPPAPPLVPEPDDEVEALQQAAQDAYDAIPPEIMAQFSPTGSGPITNDCGIRVDDGELSCCYRQAGVNCCCIFAHTCGCETVSSPNNPPSTPVAPDPDPQVDYTEPTAESMATFTLAPTDGRETQDGCWVVITGDDRGLLQCCHTIGNSRCCTWSNDRGLVRHQCEQTGPISPNNPPSAP